MKKEKRRLYDDNPFERYGWNGEFVFVDDIKIEDFDEDFDLQDLGRIVFEASDSGYIWQGNCVGIAQLRDGTYVGWKSYWFSNSGAQGSDQGGFRYPNNGEHATIIIGKSFATVLRKLGIENHSDSDSDSRLENDVREIINSSSYGHLDFCGSLEERVIFDDWLRNS